jgi:catechol-2,3-dioxygenase
VGLDHLALAVPDEAELQAWRPRLDELAISHSGIVSDPLGHHLNAKDPDGIQIEFYVPPTG